jgi:lysophospholipase L1-like esterase
MSLPRRASWALLLLAACGSDEPDPAYLRVEADYYMPDPVLGHKHRPNALREITWPEHPNGGFVMRTNNLGFREDEDTPLVRAPGTVRVLCCGDSHLDGVVDNRDSFPNVLEALLDAESPGHYEVINGGVGYYGPHQYARFLEQHLDLAPDAYVVAFYGGNDCLNVSREVHDSLPGGRDRPPGYRDALDTARDACGRAVVQALNQVHYQKQLPELAAATHGALLEQFAAIQRTCREHGIELIVVLWPSLLDAQPELDRAAWQRAAQALSLSEEDLALNRRLVVDLAEWLRAQGIVYLDMFEAMKAEREPCFWLADYHVNVHGQRLTAERVLAAYGDVLRGL